MARWLRTIVRRDRADLASRTRAVARAAAATRGAPQMSQRRSRGRPIEPEQFALPHAGRDRQHVERVGGMLAVAARKASVCSGVRTASPASALRRLGAVAGVARDQFQRIAWTNARCRQRCVWWTERAESPVVREVGVQGLQVERVSFASCLRPMRGTTRTRTMDSYPSYVLTFTDGLTLALSHLSRYWATVSRSASRSRPLSRSSGRLSACRQPPSGSWRRGICACRLAGSVRDPASVALGLENRPSP